jgi:hypothetical protein
MVVDRAVKNHGEIWHLSAGSGYSDGKILGMQNFYSLACTGNGQRCSGKLDAVQFYLR